MRKKKFVAKKVSLTPKTLAEITATLMNEGTVEIKGIGTLSLKRMRSRRGFNPGISQYEEFPAYTKLTITPNQEVKEKIQRWKK